MPRAVCSSCAAVLSRSASRSVRLVPPTLMAMPTPPVTKASPTLTPVSPMAFAVASRVSSSCERREAGVGIDAEIESELAPRRGAAGQRGDHALFMRVGRRHRRAGTAEYIADALERIGDGLAGRGDEILGGGERLQRGAPRGVDHGPGAVDLLQLRGRVDLARLHPHQVGALDGERAPSRVDREHILEVVEPDTIVDGVIRAAQQIRRQHLARRRSDGGCSYWPACGAALEGRQHNHAGKRAEQGCAQRTPETVDMTDPRADATLFPSGDFSLKPRRRQRVVRGPSRTAVFGLFEQGEIDHIQPAEEAVDDRPED